MMRKSQAFRLMVMAIFLVSGSFTVQEACAQTAPTRTVSKMNLTGEIAKARHGYIIRSRRGNAPSEIFTILNPEPSILDRFVNSEKIVAIEVRIISGDNVEIEKIDGTKYP